jgi:S-adenosylmethionine-diacylglycerol 3-amino-3-carboxypropyl transferase
MHERIEERADFAQIRYANCWEDADILCDALRPSAGRRILSIASGGDNAFALLGEGATVIAADLSAAQLACVELKVAALRSLEYAELLAFLGVTPAVGRDRTYATLRAQLSDSARRFWDSRPDTLAAGIVHAGKFERYFQLFRKRVLPFVHSRGTVRGLLAERELEDRRVFYRSRWNTWRWRLMFRVFFSRFVMGRLGRDPEFFRYVEGSVADRILARTRYALTELPTHDNPYLRYILAGNFCEEALPRYLRQDRVDAVRAGLDRLTLFHGPVQETAVSAGVDGFDGYNMSDIFEYLAPELGRHIYGTLVDRANAGARIAYWNMLAPRRFAPGFPGRVRSREEEAGRLFRHDRAFFYSAFVVEEVLP